MNIYNITGVRQNLKCKIDETNCKIIQSFDLAEDRLVNIKLSEPQSYVQNFS